MENVLAIDTSIVQDFLLGHDFSLLVTNRNDILKIICDNYMFLSRNDIESDTRYKQIIPYCLIECEGRYVLFERLKKQSERRLHMKLSLGAGGHINDSDIDANPIKIIENCIRREINEELQFTCDIANNFKFVGIINDALSVVSLSHLGLLYIITLENYGLTVKEQEKMTAHWATIDEISSKYDSLENWSKIIYKQYLKTLN